MGSQWAGVPHLGLEEKGFDKESVEIKEIDLRRSLTVLFEAVTIDGFVQ